MASKVHSLGEFEHIDEGSRLKLKTNCWLTISSFNAYEFPFSYTFQHLSSLVSTGTWIAGGNRLEIRLQLLLDGVALQVEDCFSLEEDLGIVLCNAEIWPQLGLSASLSLPVQNDSTLTSSSPEIILILSSCYDDKPEQPDRLLSTTPMNTRPPTGVPCACLEMLRLTLKLSRFHKNEWNPLKRKACQESMELAAAPLMLFETDNDDEILDEHVMFTPSSPSIPSHILDHHVATQFEYSKTLEYQPAITKMSCDLLSSPFSSITNSQSSSSSQSSVNQSSRGIRLPCNKIAQQEPAYRPVKFADLLRLIDSSLRAIIFESKAPASTLIDRSDTNEYPKLSLISPALFIPGYLEAVSQRRGLMSIISNSLSGVHRRAASASLRRKLELLVHIPPEKYLATGIPRYHGPRINLFALTAAIEARLWFLTQRKLLDSSACNKLKPLTAPTRPSASFESQFQQMLEEDSHKGTGNGVRSLFYVEGLGQLYGGREDRMGRRLEPVGILFDEEDVAHDCSENDLPLDDVPVGEGTTSDEDLYGDHVHFDDDPLYSRRPSTVPFLEGQTSNDPHHELLDMVDVPHAGSEITNYGYSIPRPLNDPLGQSGNSQDGEMLLA